MRPALLAVLLLAGCATVPKPPSATYRAIGTEPFWSLELNGREMIFSEANTRLPISEPQPRPIHGFAGDIYQGRRINLNIVRGQRCSDGMSDRIYPDRVQLRVDDRSLEGCGGEVTAPERLAGTRWTVESIHGRPTGGGKRFHVWFDAERMSGAFGCNNASGSYRYDGQTLTAGPLAMTRKACPSMRFETEAAAILSQPAIVTWSADNSVILRNQAGEISLGRAR
jgi:heat shock protein HslJ